VPYCHKRNPARSNLRLPEDAAAGRHGRFGDDELAAVRRAEGYFAKRGLNVTISQVGATVAVQGVVSGTIDIYQGGTAAIAANLSGADLIYVAAAVDRSSLILFGQKGIASLEGLRGKAIATTFPGAFGEITMRMTARKHGLEVGKDFKLLYHRSPPEALSTFSWETPMV
jgi:ABC-type nitrate/sulfonate/bicarbonate transport system substrate-binding protein